MHFQREALVEALLIMLFGPMHLLDPQGDRPDRCSRIVPLAEPLTG
jgi:hypothetical protein